MQRAHLLLCKEQDACSGISRLHGSRLQVLSCADPSTMPLLLFRRHAWLVQYRNEGNEPCQLRCHSATVRLQYITLNTQLSSCSSACRSLKLC